ncbi:MAG: hypothetical protein AAGD35_17935 [Actinomycetota bacterium]
MALLTVAIAPVGLGCALSTGTSTAAPETTSSAAGGITPAAPAAADGSTDQTAEGSRSGLVADLERAATSTTAAEPVTDEGSDSVTTTVAPPPLDAALRSRLEVFGQLHLGYDHRQDHADRVAELAVVVDPLLLEQLAVPLPAALVEELASEERIVTATMREIVPLEPLPEGGGVYRLDVDLETTTIDTGAASGEPGFTSVVVVVGPDGLIEDVR